MTGHCLRGRNRAFGCAAARPQPGVHSWPFHQCTWRAVHRSCLPPHIPVVSKCDIGKNRIFVIVSIALGLESMEVPGATPKKPFSGLMAYNRPSLPNFIQAISSPTHSTFHPGSWYQHGKIGFPACAGKKPPQHTF